MNFADIFGTLELFLPLLGSMSGHPELGAIAQKMIAIGEEEIARRQQQNPGETREQILGDAAATWETFKTENSALKNLGHENE